MSAFICDPKHFAVLGHFAAQRQFGGTHNVYQPQVARLLEAPTLVTGLDDQTYADLIANVLYKENIRSVLHRYQNDDLDSAPGPIDKPMSIKTGDWSPLKLCVKPIEILKACDCLEYQSCETDDYYETPAYEILNMIRKAAIQALPGYDEAPWGIEEAA
jgi:hypothetical protein